MLSRPIVFGLLALLAAVHLAQCNSASVLLQNLNVFPLKNEALLFEEFIHKHSKPYRTNFEEKLKRFKIFSHNLKRISELNRYERGTAVYGVTSFADLTYEEFKSQYMGLNRALYTENVENAVDNEYFAETSRLPPLFDWRQKKGVVSEVKNQEMCGSCWAFSATGNIEGVWAVKKNQSVSLSEQELVDCDTLDAGCGGGLPTNAFKTVIQLGGIESESDYPYDARQEKCHFSRNLSRVKIDSYVELPKNETYFQNYLVKNGPISIGLKLEGFNAFYSNYYLTVTFLEYNVIQVLAAYVVFGPSGSLAMFLVKCILMLAILEMTVLLFGLIQFCARVVKKNGHIGRLNRLFAVHCFQHCRLYRLRAGQLLKLELLHSPRLLHFYAFKLFGNSRITSKTFYVMAINISGFFLFVTKRM